MMKTLARLALALAFVSPAEAADDPATRKDLTSVIALQGKPCGEVVKVETRAENDHLATCKDGNRYRVRVNDKGRVVVEKA